MTPLDQVVKELRRPRAPVSAVVIGLFIVAITVLIMIGLTSGTPKP